MAPSHLKSPWSLSRTLTHHSMVTQRSPSLSWMINSHPFHFTSISPPILERRLTFKHWPWNLKANVMGMFKGQGHPISPVSNWFAFLSIHINQTNNYWDIAVSKFDLEKSKVKVMGGVKGQGEIVDSVSNRCTSFSFHIHQSKIWLVETERSSSTFSQTYTFFVPNIQS